MIVSARARSHLARPAAAHDEQTRWHARREDGPEHLGEHRAHALALAPRLPAGDIRTWLIVGGGGPCGSRRMLALRLHTGGEALRLHTDARLAHVHLLARDRVELPRLVLRHLAAIRTKLGAVQPGFHLRRRRCRRRRPSHRVPPLALRRFEPRARAPVARHVGLQPLRARRQEIRHELTLSRRVDLTTKVGVRRSPRVPQQHPHERAAASAAAQPLCRRPQRTQRLLDAADAPRQRARPGLGVESAKARHRRKPACEGAKG
eukprot:7378867-Prymnesium_polylepis.2